jgi:hypothetical protein
MTMLMPNSRSNGCEEGEWFVRNDVAVHGVSRAPRNMLFRHQTRLD